MFDVHFSEADNLQRLWPSQARQIKLTHYPAAYGLVAPDGLEYHGRFSNGVALVRYQSDGTVDPTFGAGDTVFFEFDGRNESDPTILLQSDGRFSSPERPKATATNSDAAPLPERLRAR